MKCPECGKENRAQAGFCAWCGGRLAKQAASGEPSAAQPAAPSEAATEQPTPAPKPIEAAPSSAPTEVATPAPQEAPLPGGSTPLRPGDLLAERYRIVALIESGPEGNLYRADDLYGCGACGYDDNAAQDAFCRRCGASLEAPRYVIVVERTRRAPQEYELHLTQGERDYYITPEPQTSSNQSAPPAGRPVLRLLWGRATDQGLQRDHNEDYLEAWLYVKSSGDLLGLFIVADGLGGQDSGEVASRMATDTIWQALRPSVWEPVIRDEALPPIVLEQRLVEAVKAANQAVYEARLARHSEMSTTVTLALLLNDTAYIGNVGDSRTYLWNAAGLKRITKDHSLVQRLVDLGQITPDEVYSHPQRNLIYQSIGDRPDVRVDTFQVHLVPDDHLILCSDGLWEMVHDEGLEEVLLSEPEPQRACERLVQNANLAGGEDNISVIIVKAVREAPTAR